MENVHEQLVAYLKQREDSTIRWGSPHMEQHDADLGRIYTGWVDLHVPDIQEACETNWVWTIEDSSDRPAEWEEYPHVLNLPYNLEVHIVRDPYAIRHHQNGKTWYEADDLIQVAVPVGGKLTETQAAALAEALGGGEDRNLRVVGGWTEAAINTTVEAWYEGKTGRKMTAEYEPDQPLSGMEAKLVERIEALKGGEETYLIGVTADGTEIHASSEAFETLSQLDPELAAEALRAVEEGFGAQITRTDEE